MIIAGTGYHVIFKNTKNSGRLFDLAVAALNKYKPELVISGFAPGWDRILAEAALKLEIPFQVAVPFKGFESPWPDQVQMYYYEMLDLAAGVEYVSPPGYDKEKYWARDKWMIDHADMILTLWTGKSEKLSNTLDYAQQVGKPVVNLWSSWIKYK
jgi:uncharacterized phage-like protein YoqJ